MSVWDKFTPPGNRECFTIGLLHHSVFIILADADWSYFERNWTPVISAGFIAMSVWDNFTPPGKRECFTIGLLHHSIPVTKRGIGHQ